MSTNILMYGQMGSALAQSWGQFTVASSEARMQERMRQFQNNIAQLQANRQEDVMRDNMELTRRAGVQRDAQIQTLSLQDQARAEVAAAATGVRGNSVDAVKTNIKNSGLAAIAANRAETQAQLVAAEGEIGNMRVQSTLGKNYTPTTKPSFSVAMLGAASRLLDIYNQNQP